MSATLLVISPAARLAIGAIVLALAVAFAGARRLAVALLVVLLAAIAAGARVNPLDATHEHERTRQR